MTYLIVGALGVVLLVSFFSAVGSIVAVFFAWTEGDTWPKSVALTGAALLAATLFMSATVWAQANLEMRGAW